MKEENNSLYSLLKEKLKECQTNEDGEINHAEVRECFTKYRIPKELWIKLINEMEKLKIIERIGKRTIKLNSHSRER